MTFLSKLRIGSLLVCTSLLVWGAVAQQANDNDEPVYDLGGDVSPPRLTHHVDPETPPSLRGVRLEGVVTIGMIVDSQGNTKGPHIVKSLDKDVDESAVAAVKQWKFSPAKKAGKAVAVHVTVEIQFHSM